MILDVSEHIADQLIYILIGLGLFDKNVKVTHPTSLKHADYTTSIAMQLSVDAIKNNIASSSLDLAEIIKERYLALNDEIIDEINVVNPGFINFWLSKKFISTSIGLLIDNKQIDLAIKTRNREKIMIEFTDTNPFKEFHIGHLYSNIVGESLSRLLEAQGANVRRVIYQGDVGMHVAKAVWGFMQNLENKSGQDLVLKIANLEEKSLHEKIKFLGDAYSYGSRAFEDDSQAAEQIKVLNKKIYDKDIEVMPAYNVGREWSLKYFETIYARLGTKFDNYYFESEVGPEGSKIVKEYQLKGIFEESDGAIIFPGEKYGLHNRVFINSLGLPTYEAKELGLAPRKYKDFSYDMSVIVTGNEINEYFRVLLKALELIYPDIAVKTKHISHGMVRIPEGKMSSRKGNVITGEWLLDESMHQIQDRYVKMSEDSSEKVALGAVKYSLLKFSLGSDVLFNFDESISLDGNSGPYLQYAYVRTQSILARLEIESMDKFIFQIPESSSKDELLLLRMIIQYADVINESANMFSPHILCTYLFSLAQQFNIFYQKHKILESDQRGFRIHLTTAVGIVLRDGLKILGIPVPEKM